MLGLGTESLEPESKEGRRPVELHGKSSATLDMTRLRRFLAGIWAAPESLYAPHLEVWEYVFLAEIEHSLTFKLQHVQMTAIGRACGFATARGAHSL